QLEGVAHQFVEHAPENFGRYLGWRLGCDIEPVHLQPTGSALHLFGVHVVSRPDKVHHGCIPHLIASCPKEWAPGERKRITGLGACVDCRDLELRRWLRRLAKRCDREEAAPDQACKSPPLPCPPNPPLS